MSLERNDLVNELMLRIEDGRELIDEGDYDYERAYRMAEKQVKRIRDFDASGGGMMFPVMSLDDTNESADARRERAFAADLKDAD